MNIRQQLDLILEQLLNGKLDEAEQALSLISSRDKVENRIKAHYHALLNFYRGHTSQAKERIEKAMAEFGENINLLRDLIVFQYHLLDMPGFRSGLNRLEMLLYEKEPELQKRTLLECELMLGKFMEEEARLAPALLFYDRALSRATQAPERLRVLMQKARWQAQYEPTQELSSHYRELISAPTEPMTRDQRIELQHALMMIELRLVGSDHAWRRIERLGDDMGALDRRLLIFDFVEGALSQDLPLNPSVLKIVSEFDDVDPYEQFLRKMVQAPLERGDRIDELARLASRLSWSSYLRLLCLSANSETHAPARQELNRKIQLIIRGLDPRTQALWNQRLKQALQMPEIRMELSLRSRSVTVQGKVVDLSKKKIGLQLLGGLRNKDSLTVDQAIELLWQSSFTPEHYHRLRMSTHRLNTLIHEITGLGKVIEVDSQTVRLRPEVTLKCADEPVESGLLRLS